AEYPASSQYVIAVGGTALTKSTTVTRGWVETVWGNSFLSGLLGGAGSGCSGFVSKPSWQKDTGCAKRTVADISAVASPSTGPAVYSSFGFNGWATVGGTSAACPIAATAFAMAGVGNKTAQIAYGNPTAFYDVTSGSNGFCSPGYLCTGKAGYDG